MQGSPQSSTVSNSVASTSIAKNSSAAKLVDQPGGRRTPPSEHSRNGNAKVVEKRFDGDAKDIGGTKVTIVDPRVSHDQKVVVKPLNLSKMQNSDTTVPLSGSESGRRAPITPRGRKTHEYVVI